MSMNMLYNCPAFVTYDANILIQPVTPGFFNLSQPSTYIIKSVSYDTAFKIKFKNEKPSPQPNLCHINSDLRSKIPWLKNEHGSLNQRNVMFSTKLAQSDGTTTLQNATNKVNYAIDKSERILLKSPIKNYNKDNVTQIQTKGIDKINNANIDKYKNLDDTKFAQNVEKTHLQNQPNKMSNNINKIDIIQLNSPIKSMMQNRIDANNEVTEFVQNVHKTNLQIQTNKMSNIISKSDIIQLKSPIKNNNKDSITQINNKGIDIDRNKNIQSNIDANIEEKLDTMFAQNVHKTNLQIQTNKMSNIISKSDIIQLKSPIKNNNKDSITQINNKGIDIDRNKNIQSNIDANIEEKLDTKFAQNVEKINLQTQTNKMGNIIFKSDSIQLKSPIKNNNKDSITQINNKGIDIDRNKNIQSNIDANIEEKLDTKFAQNVEKINLQTQTNKMGNIIFKSDSIQLKSPIKNNNKDSITQIYNKDNRNKNIKFNIDAKFEEKLENTNLVQNFEKTNLQNQTNKVSKSNTNQIKSPIKTDNKDIITQIKDVDRNKNINQDINKHNIDAKFEENLESEAKIAKSGKAKPVNTKPKVGITRTAKNIYVKIKGQRLAVINKKNVLRTRGNRMKIKSIALRTKSKVAKRNDLKDNLENMAVKEVKALKKEFEILTHVIDGIVLQESNRPFEIKPIRKCFSINVTRDMISACKSVDLVDWISQSVTACPCVSVLLEHEVDGEALLLCEERHLSAIGLHDNCIEALISTITRLK